MDVLIQSIDSVVERFIEIHFNQLNAYTNLIRANYPSIPITSRDCPPTRVIRSSIVDLTEFLNSCRVTGSSITLHDGDIPMIRIKLRAGNKTRTVTPSRWLDDLINSYIGSYSPDFNRYFKTCILNSRYCLLDKEICMMANSILSDKTLVSDIKKRIQKKRDLEKKRQMKYISVVFKRVHDILTEEDIIGMWRESQCGNVLES